MSKGSENPIASHPIAHSLPQPGPLGKGHICVTDHQKGPVTTIYPLKYGSRDHSNTRPRGLGGKGMGNSHVCSTYISLSTGV